MSTYIPAVTPQDLAPEGQRWCKDCQTYKAEGIFPRNRGYKSGRLPYCRDCQRERIYASRQRIREGKRLREHRTARSREEVQAELAYGKMSPEAREAKARRLLAEAAQLRALMSLPGDSREGRAPQAKACTRCGETKPLRLFHRDSSRLDNRASACKDCRNRRRKGKT